MLKEKELANLDKQTLIKMLVAATESNQKLSKAAEQLQKSVNLLTEEVVSLRPGGTRLLAPVAALLPGGRYGACAKDLLPAMSVV